MDDRVDEWLQIEAFLKESKLESLIPNLELARNRERSRVYAGQLLTSIGDAVVEIIVYSLKEDPGLIVEYEEEKSALLAFAMAEERWHLVPELVLERQTKDLAILVTTSPDDAKMVRRYLDSFQTEDSTKSVNIHCELSYHPQLDRLFGGDYLYEQEGHIIKVCLLSLDRAKKLIKVINDLVETYVAVDPTWRTKSGRPFPIPLAVRELKGYPAYVAGEQKILSIEELFTLDPLAMAPAEYHNLSMMHMLIPHYENLLDRKPTNGDNLLAFTRQLFRIVNCGHRHLQATFSRGSGCCLRPESITPNGQLNELYFLTQSVGELTPQILRQSQHTDLVNAFDVLCQLASSETEFFPKVLREALVVYAYPDDIPHDLMDITIDTARILGSTQYDPKQAGRPLMILAASILESYFQL